MQRIHDRSASLVGSVVFVALLFTAAIAFVAIAPLSVTLPIGVVLFAYLVLTVLLVSGERSQQQHRDERDGASRAPGGEAPVAAAGRPVPAGVGTLAMVSLGLLILGALVPPRVGAAFATVGLAGLFIGRLALLPARGTSRAMLAGAEG